MTLPTEAETSKHVSGSRIDESELKYLAERSGRVCKTPGCKTKLRLSNPGKYCSPCLEGKTSSSKRMRMMPVSEPVE